MFVPKFVPVRITLPPFFSPGVFWILSATPDAAAVAWFEITIVPLLLEPADDIEETVVFAGIPAPEMYCPALILVVVIAEIVVDALVVVPLTAYGA